jgi:hypothetical protein
MLLYYGGFITNQQGLSRRNNDILKKNNDILRPGRTGAGGPLAVSFAAEDKHQAWTSSTWQFLQRW